VPQFKNKTSQETTSKGLQSPAAGGVVGLDNRNVFNQFFRGFRLRWGDPRSRRR
jgi:hypothetical protein